MSDELFPEADVLAISPKLKWMRRHGITTKQHDWTGTDFEDTDEPRWQALSSTKYPIQGPSCRVPVIWTDKGPRAETEEEAIVQLAIHMGIKLWNEETP